MELKRNPSVAVLFCALLEYIVIRLSVIAFTCKVLAFAAFPYLISNSSVMVFLVPSRYLDEPKILFNLSY
jgi:hypothetical protein